MGMALAHPRSKILNCKHKWIIHGSTKRRKERQLESNALQHRAYEAVGHGRDLDISRQAMKDAVHTPSMALVEHHGELQVSEDGLVGKRRSSLRIVLSMQLPLTANDGQVKAVEPKSA